MLPHDSRFRSQGSGVRSHKLRLLTPDSRLLTPVMEPQIKDDQSLVLQSAAEVGAQVAVQAAVIFKPPERVWNEDHEVRTQRPQPLELTNRGGAIGRLAPVSPPALQERDAAAAAEDRASPPRILIHQDEGVPRSDERRDPPQGPVYLVPPAIRPPSAQVRGNAGGLATTAQGAGTIRLRPQA